MTEYIGLTYVLISLPYSIPYLFKIILFVAVILAPNAHSLPGVSGGNNSSSNMAMNMKGDAHEERSRKYP
jgi:hypothetical protein